MFQVKLNVLFLWVLMGSIYVLLQVAAKDQEFCSNKEDGLYGNPEDDTKFYYCDHHLSYTKDCPDGQYFAEKWSRCISSSKNEYKLVLRSTRSTPENFKCVGSGIFPDKENCSIFHECSERHDADIHTIGTCRNDLVFCKKTSICEPKSKCSCINQNTSEEKQEYGRPIFYTENNFQGKKYSATEDWHDNECNELPSWVNADELHSINLSGECLILCAEKGCRDCDERGVRENLATMYGEFVSFKSCKSS